MLIVVVLRSRHLPERNRPVSIRVQTPRRWQRDRVLHRLVILDPHGQTLQPTDCLHVRRRRPSCDDGNSRHPNERGRQRSRDCSSGLSLCLQYILWPWLCPALLAGTCGDHTARRSCAGQRSIDGVELDSQLLGRHDHADLLQ